MSESTRRHLGIALFSGSALLLEIALARLFSTLFFPPYVFFILSIAVLGIALGAALPALKPKLAGSERIALYGGGAALCTVNLALVAVLGAGFPTQISLFLLAALPFAFVGLALSCLFARHSGSSRTLYMSDLLGAGIGAALAIPLLNQFGAVNAVLIAALGFACASLYFDTRQHRALLWLIAAFASLAFAANVTRGILRIDMSALSAEKPIVDALSAGGGIRQTRWDAFARTDLVFSSRGEPPRMYVDGGAASIMPTDAAAPQLLRDIGFFPFATAQPQSVFVLGPGAGLDVYFALRARAQTITAVEVNQASVELVQSLAALNGNLYSQPGLTVIVDDGRSALQRSGERYDLIYLSQVVTLAAERGGYALSENTVYTVEAFQEYLAKLSAEGQIALKLYDEVTLTRALSTALAALGRRGLDEQAALQQVMAFVDDRSSPATPLLLVGAQPFSRDDSLALGAIARDVGFKPLFLPQALAQPPLADVAAGLTTFQSIIDGSALNIAPATDDRPYFFQFERGMPRALLPLTLSMAGILLALLIYYLRFWQGARPPAERYLPLYVALLGIGFMALEIYAIQRTRLFLGHPTAAVTLVLATFLVGGGIGSGLSRMRPLAALKSRAQLPPAAVALLAVVWALLWLPVSGELQASSFPLRALAAVVTLLPLALCMGMPFPQALEQAGTSGPKSVAAAWAINGLMTVAGSVAAVLLSITVGFSAVLALGAGAYLLAALLQVLMRRQPPL